MSTLPVFRYHPDPVRSGSVVESAAACRCCLQTRGFIYVGPSYAEKEFVEALCPWCIADGSAARRFDATFVDSEAFDADASEDAMRVITERTPGYNSWQGEQWPSCCGEPAAFLTPAGADDIASRFPRLEGALLSYIVYELGYSGAAATRLLHALARDHSPTAYIFQCLHCDNQPVYVDAL